jgi:hypothetical protein
MRKKKDLVYQLFREIRSAPFPKQLITDNLRGIGLPAGLPARYGIGFGVQGVPCTFFFIQYEEK